MTTIFALASARGKAGVAIVRVSGEASWGVVRRLCAVVPPPRIAALRQLVWQGDPIDTALVLTFEAGKSFTGEQSAELHLHGSTAVVARVLGILAEIDGCRLAEPGEFTRRALENGQLDLAQVEGLADLVEAETEAQRKQALRVLDGHIGKKVDVWRSDLLRAAALIEATIDFADEEVPQDVSPEVEAAISRTLDDLRAEIVRSVSTERVRDGFEVAIVGAPNAGKSTLLNAIAGRDVAITSAVAGTTRDVIEVRMDLGGLPVTLLDTAGLRDATDEVEQIGISRAIDRAEAADLRVFLLTEPGENLGLQPRPDDIVVAGKSDLHDGPGVSGKTGAGIDNLVDEIQRKISARVAGAGLLIRERQRIAVRKAVDGLERAQQLLRRCEGAELVALELRSANHSLEMLIGKIGTEALLGEIFSKFCIGK